MIPRTLVWFEGGWGLWKHNISKADRGSWGEYMLFHHCGAERNHRAARRPCGSYVCVRCEHVALDGAIALLEMMNWDNNEPK